MSNGESALVTQSMAEAKISAITLFVDDLAKTKKFYETVFGLEVLFEDEESAAFRFGNAIVNLLHEAAAPELISPAQVAPADAGSRMQLTIDVTDVDATCEELTSRGARLLSGPVDRPWGVRTATFADPGGHIWELAAPIAPR